MIKSSMAIQATRMSKDFDGRAVLRKVSLNVAESECIALAGANGSGKTTLLRCLAGASRPNTGTVLWYGQEAISNPDARRLIGYLAHESCLYPHMTLRENLVFAARMSDVPMPAERADELIESTGLVNSRHRLPTQVSRGMRQRLSIVRAMVHDPRILMLDEPFTGLDSNGTEWLVGLLRDLRTRGRAVCFATHDLKLSQRFTDRVVSLKSGRLLDCVAEELSSGKADFAATARHVTGRD
jgi:heme ABC exporter ATP-binding subunit CcmA